MHRLEPDNAHYVDEMETSLYNVLLAVQVGDQGYHYLNFLQQNKDWRYLDIVTCCASLGTRLVSLLPQFLYTYTDNSVNCDIYAASQAQLPNGVSLQVETNMPDDGHVTVRIVEAKAPFTLRLRIPQWAAEDGQSYYEIHESVNAEVIFHSATKPPSEFSLYTGGEEIPHKERWAVEYGPLLYAMLGAPNPLTVTFDPAKPQDWVTSLEG